MDFTVDGRFFKLFPDLKVAYMVVEGNLSKPEKDTLNLLKEASKTATEKVTGKPQDLPEIEVWREAFRKVGISPSKFYSSVEALLRRCLKGSLPGPIHPFVDLYNAFSLKNLVPVGGHDMNKVEGYISVTFTEGGERFITLDGAVEEVPRNEPVYKDSKGVLTRRWVWRQTSRDLIRDETTRVFVPIDVIAPGLRAEDLLEELKSLVLDFFPGSKVVSCGILKKGKEKGKLIE